MPFPITHRTSTETMKEVKSSLSPPAKRTAIIDRKNVIAKTANINNSKTINKGYKKRATVSNSPILNLI